MMSIEIVMPGFDKDEIDNTVKAKTTPVDGESFIVDWSDGANIEPKREYERATNSFHSLYGPAFVPQRNHHSTIISKRLDPIDRVAAETPPEWIDISLATCQAVFNTHLKNLVLELELCVLAKGGTIQLVYRNKKALPQIRKHLINLGAEVKPLTLEGNRMYTCTVVLGYLCQKPTNEITKQDISNAIASVPTMIPVSCASLIRYFDTSLNRYETIARFVTA